jgi:hypothetical protein
VAAPQAYRDPITNEWKRREPDPDALAAETEPHARGAMLVAAVFDAFLAIYRHRTSDLLRIATGGTGVLPEGDLHPDLVNRLANDAAKTAHHLLLMCIRAIDYCPPVDVTFGDYLRALITADFDLVPDDDRKYRVAFIEAFRKWGIYPYDVRTLSVESLRWRPPEGDGTEAFAAMLRPAFFSDHLSRIWGEIVSGRVTPRSPLASAAEKLDRMAVEAKLREFRCGFHTEIGQLASHMLQTGELGGKKRPFGFNLNYGTEEDYKFEVHQMRPVHRIGPDGRTRSDLLIEITQRRPGFLDTDRQKREDERYHRHGQTIPPPRDFDFWYRGGATFILDLETFEVRYAVCKDILSRQRLDTQREFLTDIAGSSLRELYFGKATRAERLAQLHACDL